MNQDMLARSIYDIIGPKANINKAMNCMTRLRVELVKQTPAQSEALQALDGVLGLNQSGPELQIILGPGRAAGVTAALQELMQADAVPPSAGKTASLASSIGDGKELHAAIRQKNATPVKLFFRRIASIFVPLIPGFIACGLITGLLNIALKLDPALASYAAVQLLNVMGNAMLFGLDLFVGVNAAKEFGGTPILGGVLAAVITHPQLAHIALYGEPLVPGRGGIIAVVLVAAFGAWLEKRLHPIIPEMLDLFLTPLLVLLIAGAAAIFILQPIGGNISEGIGTAAAVSIGKGGAITGFLLGGTFLPMVMCGIHQAITPIHAELLARDGVTILLPILAMAGCGQVGASLAVWCKTKNHFLKKTIISALPVGLMGVGEPLIYGVTLPLGKPFIGACIGGACGGAIQASFTVGAAAMGISGLPLAAVTDNIPVYLLGLLTAYITGFIATWIIGFDDPLED
jgi:PTS system sucrose-specific IIC component